MLVFMIFVIHRFVPFLGLLKRYYHGGVSMMTTSKCLLFSFESGSPSPRPHCACYSPVTQFALLLSMNNHDTKRPLLMNPTLNKQV